MIDNSKTLQGDSTTLLRIPSYIWIALILAQGIVFTLEPLWSAVLLIILIFSILFIFTALSNVRITLTMVLLVSLFFPVKLFIYSLAEFAHIDFCTIMNVGLLFILWTIGAMQGKFQYSRTPLDAWFIALGILIILNCIFSKDFLYSIHSWQHFLIPGPVIFLLVFNYFTTSEQIRKAFTLIIASIIITGFYLFIEHTLGYNPIYHKLFLTHGHYYDPFNMYYRATGFGGHSIFNGVLMVTFAPFMIFGMLKSAGTKSRLFWGLATLTVILGTAATNTRGSAITIVIVILLMTIRSLKSFLIALLISTVLVILMIKTGMVASVMIRLDPKYLMGDVSLWHRLLMLWSTFNIFRDYPILGAGLGSIWELYPLYKHPLDIIDYKGVDNQFMTFLYGTGLVGLIIIGGLLSKILHYISKHGKNGQSALMKSFRRTGCVGIIAFYIISLTCDPLDWVHTNLPFWFTVALLMRLVTLPNQEIAKFFRLYGYKETSPELQPVKRKPPKL